MSSIPTLPGIGSQMIQTSRLNIHVLTSGPEDGTPILLIHGNASSATYWEDVMLALPDSYRAIAPDLRGYGDTEEAGIDATLGLGDIADDVYSLVQTLGLSSYHMMGHSMGGGVTMRYMLSHASELKSVTLVAPASPYGYGGSKDLDGTPCYEDGAPAGAGGANPEFVKLLGENYRGDDNPMAPVNVMRQFYGKAPFVHAREEALLSGMLSMRISEDVYPGDSVPSENWPGAAPGVKGILNALTRKYFDVSGIVDLADKPPILWVRGPEDLIVSNAGMFEIATLGSMGLVPGWPGAEDCPAQPMVDQTRHVLEQYQTNGGTFTELVIEDTGHSPYLEKPDEFNQAFHAFLNSNS